MLVFCLPVMAKEPWPSVKKTYGPVTATVAVSSKDIDFGDCVECRITLEYPIDVVLISLPDLINRPGKFAVADARPPETKFEANKMGRTVLWYKLEPALPGRHAIEPQEIRFADRRAGERGGEYRFETPEISIDVRGSVQGEADWAKLKDIRAERRGPFKISWPWVAALLVAASFLAALYIRLIRNAPPAPPMPAHLWADVELDRLLRANLIDKGCVDEFVARLSNILRQYIERRFSLRAPDRTTEEFYLELNASSALNNTQQSSILEFLRRADLVKFAADHPDEKAAALLLDTVRAFVRETRENPHAV